MLCGFVNSNLTMHCILLVAVITWLSNSASVDAEILYQKWMTTDPKIIPVARIRADCRDGDLVTSAGLAPFTRTSLINVTVVLPPQYNDCTQNSQSNRHTANNLASFLTTCYGVEQCRQVGWNSADFDYSCRSPQKLEDLRKHMTLEISMYCQAPEELKLSTAPRIPRTQELCPNGWKKTVGHIFLQSNSCPKPLGGIRQVDQELYRLANALNRPTTRRIRLSAFNFTRPNCPSSDRTIGIYWDCGAKFTISGTSSSTTSTIRSTSIGSQPATESVSRTREIVESTTERQTVTVSSSVGVPEAFSKTTSLPEKGELAPSTNSDDTEVEKEEQEKTYLNALIGVSVAFVLVILILIAVVIYFLRYKDREVKHRKFTGSFHSSGPPSRQALYSTVSESLKMCGETGGESRSSHGSNERYQPAKLTEEAKMSDPSDHKYSLEGDNNYADPDADDTYEMIDTNFLSNKKVPERRDSEKYSYGYMIPVKKITPTIAPKPTIK